MNYYLITRKISKNSSLLDQVSHIFEVEFSTGTFFPQSFNTPLIVSLDKEFIHGEMATIYMTPAVIATKVFYQDLIQLGIGNIESHPVVIQVCGLLKRQIWSASIKTTKRRI